MLGSIRSKEMRQYTLMPAAKHAKAYLDHKTHAEVASHYVLSLYQVEEEASPSRVFFALLNLPDPMQVS